MTSDLIDTLGGPSAVAKELGLTPSAVANWRLPGRNIPWRWRHTIARMASERGAELPSDFWKAAA